MEQENLDEIQWRAPEFIQQFGLRTDNVLEYFSHSPFYDRTSNNQVLKMQSQFNENMHGRPNLYEELQNMQGVEFVVYLANEQSQFWIIRKQDRLSPHDVRLLATYFVVGENIYMAPSIYSVVNSRLLTTTLALRQALEKAVSLPTYSPSQGYSYVTDESALTVDAQKQQQQQQRQAGGKSTYSTPMPAQTPASSQNSQNINSNIAIPTVDDYKSRVYMERALMFTNSNQTKYIDGVETESAEPLEALSRVGTPQTNSPGVARRRK